MAVTKFALICYQINGLAFPQKNNSMVIFGKGYGIHTLKQIPWLAKCKIYYWGDIDTDGFAMLSQIRSYYPRTQSLLMDEATLLACKAFWGEEAKAKKQTPEVLTDLTPEEAQVYRRLKEDHWQPRLRL